MCIPRVATANLLILQQLLIFYVSMVLEFFQGQYNVETETLQVAQDHNGGTS